MHRDGRHYFVAGAGGPKARGPIPTPGPAGQDQRLRHRLVRVRADRRGDPERGLRDHRPAPDKQAGRSGQGLCHRWAGVSGLWTLLIATIVAVALLTGAERDAQGRVTDSGSESVFDLRTGDCMNDLEETAVELSVDVTPCGRAARRRGRVGVLPDRVHAWPGLPFVARQAERRCPQEVESASAGAPRPDEIETFYFHPTEESWDQNNDRAVLCVAIFPSRRRGALVAFRARPAGRPHRRARMGQHSTAARMTEGPKPCFPEVASRRRVAMAALLAFSPSSRSAAGRLQAAPGGEPGRLGSPAGKSGCIHRAAVNRCERGRAVTSPQDIALSAPTGVTPTRPPTAATRSRSSPEAPGPARCASCRDGGAASATKERAPAAAPARWPGPPRSPSAPTGATSTWPRPPAARSRSSLATARPGRSASSPGRAAVSASGRAGVVPAAALSKSRWRWR